MAVALLQAVEDCRYIQAKLLLDQGVNINCKNNKGFTPLMTALCLPDRMKRFKMFRWLIRHGADSSQLDGKYGRDLLSWAAYFNRTDQVSFILDVDEGLVNIHHQDVHGRTAMHYATMHDNPDALLLLVTHAARFGLTVDVQDQDGLTPYLLATMMNFQRCCKVLVEAGNAVPSQMVLLNVGIEDDVEDSEEKENIHRGRKNPNKNRNKNKVTDNRGLNTMNNDDISNPNNMNNTNLTTSPAHRSLPNLHPSRSAPQPNTTFVTLPPVRHSMPTHNKPSSRKLDTYTSTIMDPQTSLDQSAASEDWDSASSMLQNQIQRKKKSLPRLMDMLSQQASKTYLPPAQLPTMPLISGSKGKRGGGDKQTIGFHAAVRISTMAASFRKRKQIAVNK